MPFKSSRMLSATLRADSLRDLTGDQAHHRHNTNDPNEPQSSQSGTASVQLTGFRPLGTIRGSPHQNGHSNSNGHNNHHRSHHHQMPAIHAFDNPALDQEELQLDQQCDHHGDTDAIRHRARGGSAQILPDMKYTDTDSGLEEIPLEETSLDRLSRSGPSSPSSFSPSTSKKTNSIGSASEKLCAVVVRDVQLKYSSTGQVLNRLSMTVHEGEIYGLLGPSGCGKTTLLRAIVGRLQPQAGLVEVFGYEPRDPASHVPGATVGYMPQEVALYDDYSIEELLMYFGRLYRTDKTLLEERIDFLVTFLDLPDKSRLIYTLSGGQKRRVSFAAALVHKPPLVILDEPTAGVDPLLRSKMWSHLVALAETERMTFIVTTHYIEEARRAHSVGFMRAGQILSEGSPRELQAIHGVSTLEDVFLKLCVRQNALQNPVVKIATTSYDCHNPSGDVSCSQTTTATNSAMTETVPYRPDLIAGASASMERQLSTVSSARGRRAAAARLALSPSDSLQRARLRSRIPPALGWHAWFLTLWALFAKNFIRNLRHPALIVFQLGLPAMQVILFCICIGRDPVDIRIGVVNEDQPNILSRLFLNSVDKYATDLIDFPTLEGGLEAARRRQVWGVMHIPENFSTAVQTRLDFDDGGLDNTTLKSGTIRLYADLTDKLITVYVQRTLQDAFQQFAKGAVMELDLNPSLAQFPIKLERAVHGAVDPAAHRGYTEYMAPGVIVSVTYVMATGLTALLFIIERNEGMFERTLVAGVDTGQMLTAHAINRILYMFIQMFAVMLVVFGIFAIPIKGSILLVWSLLVLQNCAGMACGILVSSICRYQETATIVVVGLMFVNLFMSGIIWPLEAIPLWIRWFAIAQPSTQSVEALRGIISRGFGLRQFSVWTGFASTLIWLAIFMIAASKVIKYAVINPNR